MQHYLVIVGTDVLKAISKGNGLYFTSGYNKEDAVVNLHRKYPSLDTTLPVYVIKVSDLGSIDAVVKKKTAKDAEEKKKIIEKFAARNAKMEERKKKELEKDAKKTKEKDKNSKKDK